MKEIKHCPGTLAEGFDKYSPLCLKRVFNGKSVNHILDFSYDAEENDIADYINQISVSGVQEKLSAIVNEYNKAKVITDYVDKVNCEEEIRPIREKYNA